MTKRAATRPMLCALAAAAGTRAYDFHWRQIGADVATSLSRPSPCMLCFSARPCGRHFRFSWVVREYGFRNMKMACGRMSPRGFEVRSETASMSYFRN